jgi:hypothetical protein
MSNNGVPAPEVFARQKRGKSTMEHGVETKIFIFLGR